MSLENAQPRPEDIQAAMALIAEHPLLKDDPLTKKVLGTGMGGNDKPVDLDKFVEARGALLELDALRNKLTKLKEGDPEIFDAIAVSSVRPDLERYIN